MNNYTYPVLMEDDSSYKKDIIFKLTNVKYSFDIDSMNVEMDCELTSEYLKSLIKNEEAYILISASTVMNKVVSKIYVFEENIRLCIPLDSLIDCDNISIQAFVLVRKPFELKYIKEEMDEFYSDFKGKKVGVNTQLAFSNTSILYYRTAEDSFVALSKSEGLEGKGLRIEYSNSDSILVKAGNSFCDAYAALSKNEVIKELMNCFIAFIGIYYTTIAIKSNKNLLEKIEDYEWFDGYDYLFTKKGISITEFFESDADDINDLFENVQQLLGNELENTFIRCREMLKNKKGDNSNE